MIIQISVYGSHFPENKQRKPDNPKKTTNCLSLMIKIELSC